MDPVLPLQAIQAIIAEFLQDDGLIRHAAERYPAWLERQQWVVQTKKLVPDAFKGTPLEDWTPFMASINVFPTPLPAVASSSSAIPTPVPTDQAEAATQSIRQINSATADRARAYFTRTGRPAKAEVLDAALREEGWGGFPYLGDQSLEQSRWTLYRVLQSRPTVFTLFGEGRWGLAMWKSAGIPNPQEDTMT